VWHEGLTNCHYVSMRVVLWLYTYLAQIVYRSRVLVRCSMGMHSYPYSAMTRCMWRYSGVGNCCESARRGQQSGGQQPQQRPPAPWSPGIGLLRSTVLVMTVVRSRLSSRSELLHTCSTDTVSRHRVVTRHAARPSRALEDWTPQHCFRISTFVLCNSNCIFTSASQTQDPLTHSEPLFERAPALV
jgi:hypothetical protein